MKYRPPLILSLLLVCLMHPALFAQTDDWQALLTKADRFRTFAEDGFSFQCTISDGNAPASQSSSMRVYLKATDPSTVICVYTAPVGMRGRRILVQNNAFWLLDRNMRDPIRISARQMLFGQASVGDITRITFADNYHVISAAATDDQAVLELARRPGVELSYPTIRLTLGRASGKPIRAELFAGTGTLMKTIDYLTFSRIGERELLTSFRIVNALNRSESMVTLDQYSPDTLADRFFTREGIRMLP